MEKKMTKKEMFAQVIAMAQGEEVTVAMEEIVAFAEHEVELLAKKAENKKSKGASAENVALAETVYSVLAETGRGMTVSEIQKYDADLTDLSTPKVTALLKILMDAGRVVRTTDKKRTEFTAVVDTDEEQFHTQKGAVFSAPQGKEWWHLKYNHNGKTLNIPDIEIEKIMKGLEVDKDEAIEIWLEDNEYEINEEQEALHQVAKQVRVDHGARADQPQKDKRERTVKISDEKQTLFTELKAFLTENYENVTVLKENKLFEVKIGDKTFKLDLIQQRDKK